MQKINNKPLILISNDDGYRADGIKSLINAVRPISNIIVVAPAEEQSGMSRSITSKIPLRVELISKEDDLTIYSCSGTPVDCLKIGLDRLLNNQKPDLILSGINHGSNYSASLYYSGTMGIAMEALQYNIPSIGFSLVESNNPWNFTQYESLIQSIVQWYLSDAQSLAPCLNINIPNIGADNLKGIKVCRHADGVWHEEYCERKDPSNKTYYWLTGHYSNRDSNPQDTDAEAIKNGYISIAPVQLDLNDYNAIQRLNNIDLPTL